MSKNFSKNGLIRNSSNLCFLMYFEIFSMSFALPLLGFK
nr:MAG TPA: hypothetical protein [Caudoviricetes sp.]